jgi:hypothetical protein
MNDYLAQKREDQIGNPTVESEFAGVKFVEDDTEFIVKDINPQSEQPQNIEPEDMYVDEYGFIVRPNPGAEPNPINVGVLLGDQGADKPQSGVRESIVVGDSEFTVIEKKSSD